MAESYAAHTRSLEAEAIGREADSEDIRGLISTIVSDPDAKPSTRNESASKTDYDPDEERIL